MGRKGYATAWGGCMDIRQGEIREQNSNIRSMGLSQHIAEKLIPDQDKAGGHFEQLHRSRAGEVSARSNSVNFKLADSWILSLPPLNLWGWQLLLQ